MTLDEQLSALLDGDLTSTDEAALRARIATEPDVADAWAAMSALVVDLEALPSVAVPPAVSRAPARPWGAVAGWALAAAAALWITWPVSPSSIVLASGETWVEGDVELLAGDLRIDVDGRARIFVEPLGGTTREGMQEDPMNIRTLIAGLAGAAITISVYEGVAVVSADNSTVTVPAGQTHETAPTAAPALPAPGTPERAANLTARVAALDAELKATKESLATERFSGALTRGQLLAERGMQSEWPSDVPVAAQPEHIESSLTDALDGLDGVAVSHLDCDEYPCVVALRYTGPIEDKKKWQTALAERVEGWRVETFGDHSSLSSNTSVYTNDDHQGRFVMFGAFQGSGEVKVRTNWRIDQLVESVGTEMANEAAAGE